MEAIKSVLKDAEVTATGCDDWPVVVTIKTAEGQTVWTGAQRRLFRKYAGERSKAINEIQEAVKKLA